MPQLSRNPIQEAAQIVEQDRAAQIGSERLGRPSLFTCPDCSGTLWQVNEPDLPLFRCHVGHILTGEELLAGQTRAAENATWFAIRTLNDKMVLAHELADFARAKGAGEDADRLEAQARAAERQAEALRELFEAAIPNRET